MEHTKYTAIDKDGNHLGHIEWTGGHFQANKPDGTPVGNALKFAHAAKLLARKTRIADRRIVVKGAYVAIDMEEKEGVAAIFAYQDKEKASAARSYTFKEPITPIPVHGSRGTYVVNIATVVATQLGRAADPGQEIEVIGITEGHGMEAGNFIRISPYSREWQMGYHVVTAFQDRATLKRHD